MFFSKTILLWTAPKSRRSWVSRNFSTVDVWSQEVGAGSSWVEFSTTWDLRWCSHCRPNSIIAARPNCWKRSRRRTRRVPVREQLLLPKLGLRTSSQKKSIEKSAKKNVLFVVPSFHYLVPSPSFPFFRQGFWFPFQALASQLAAKTEEAGKFRTNFLAPSQTVYAADGTSADIKVIHGHLRSRDDLVGGLEHE